jgi:hypothetical protein
MLPNKLKKKAYHLLVMAFLALADHCLLSLRFHYRKNTPFLHGDKSHLFSDGEGGICVCLAAFTETIPSKPVIEGSYLFRYADTVLDIFNNTTHRFYKNFTFLEALRIVDQKAIRRAIKSACIERKLWAKDGQIRKTR